MGPFEAQIVSTIFGILGGVGALGLILHFKLKKKELEMRGSDPELGPVVDALRDDLNETRAQLADCRNDSILPSACLRVPRDPRNFPRMGARMTRAHGTRRSTVKHFKRFGVFLPIKESFGVAR